MDIDLNPATMIEGGSRLDQGQVGDPWAFSTFTRDSTLEQLDDAAEFEVYHEPGEAAAAAARRNVSRP